MTPILKMVKKLFTQFPSRKPMQCTSVKRHTTAVAVAAGGTVVGAGAIIDRGEEPVRFDVPFDALAQIPLPAYESGVCPMCARGEPVSKPGSRPSSS